MAKIFCRFCGHEFHAHIVEYLRCPDCEYADVPHMFQLLEWQDNEIVELWDTLQSSFNRGGLDFGTDLVALFVPKTEDNPWGRLLLDVLIYDKVLICEQWKLPILSHTGEEYSDIILRLFDLGIVYLIDDPETLEPLRGYRGEASSLTSRIEKAPNYLNLLDMMGTALPGNPVRSYWLLDKYAHFLTADSLLNDSEKRKLLFAAHDRAFTRGAPDLYGILNQSNRFQILAVLLDSQLSLHHDWVNPVMREFDFRNSRSSTDLLNEIVFESRFVNSPTIRNIDDLLLLRESRAFCSFRQKMLELRGSSSSDITENLVSIRRSIDENLSEINARVESTCQYISLSTTGILASAGSLLGGLPGAVLGGIGGTAIGKASEMLAKKWLKKRNRNWAMIVHDLTSRSDK